MSSCLYISASENIVYAYGMCREKLRHKFGYTTEVLKVTDMLQNADNKLFSLMFRSSHCLHTLLPDLKVIDIVLRNSGTSFNLPHCSYKLYKQSFVNRCLFRDCY